MIPRAAFNSKEKIGILSFGTSGSKGTKKQFSLQITDKNSRITSICIYDQTQLNFFIEYHFSL